MADASRAAVGVFDSGVGGLSVLRALRAQLPAERFVYFADAAHAPYGEQAPAQVRKRTLQVVDHLFQNQPCGIKLLVVACNTATAAAVQAVRERWPHLPVVGLEPALKPAAIESRTGCVAVLATRGTLQSEKFQALRHAVATRHPHLRVRAIACDGLAAAIEADDQARIDALAARYLEQAGPLGTSDGQTDCVVLGCTHYPFAADSLRRHAPADVRFFDTALPVALQAQRLLAERAMAGAHAGAPVALESSGDTRALQAFAQRWLQLDPSPAATRS